MTRESDDLEDFIEDSMTDRQWRRGFRRAERRSRWRLRSGRVLHFVGWHENCLPRRCQKAADTCNALDAEWTAQEYLRKKDDR